MQLKSFENLLVASFCSIMKALCQLLLISISCYAFQSDDFNRLCLNEIKGYLRHPLNCHKFIKCSHQKAYEFQCPSNLLWHHEIKSCDFPYRTPCLQETTRGLNAKRNEEISDKKGNPRNNITNSPSLFTRLKRQARANGKCKTREKANFKTTDINSTVSVVTQLKPNIQKEAFKEKNLYKIKYMQTPQGTQNISKNFTDLIVDSTSHDANFGEATSLSNVLEYSQFNSGNVQQWNYTTKSLDDLREFSKKSFNLTENFFNSATFTNKKITDNEKLKNFENVKLAKDELTESSSTKSYGTKITYSVKEITSFRAENVALESETLPIEVPDDVKEITNFSENNYILQNTPAALVHDITNDSDSVYAVATTAANFPNYSKSIEATKTFKTSIINLNKITENWINHADFTENSTTDPVKATETVTENLNDFAFELTYSTYGPSAVNLTETPTDNVAETESGFANNTEDFLHVTKVIYNSSNSTETQVARDNDFANFPQQNNLTVDISESNINSTENFINFVLLTEDKTSNSLKKEDISREKAVTDLVYNLTDNSNKTVNLTEPTVLNLARDKETPSSGKGMLLLETSDDKGIISSNFLSSTEFATDESKSFTENRIVKTNAMPVTKAESKDESFMETTLENVHNLTQFALIVNNSQTIVTTTPLTAEESTTLKRINLYDNLVEDPRLPFRAKMCQGPNNSLKFSAFKCFQYFQCFAGWAFLLNCHEGWRFETQKSHCVLDVNGSCDTEL